MKRRSRKVKMARKGGRPVRRKKPRRDPLDDFIQAGAHSLGLKIDKAWLPVVRRDLQVTLRHGALVGGFALPDDAEPAPVFRA